MEAARTATSGSSDERRLTVRAYQHWAGLLRGRPCPDAADCDFLSRPEFAPHVILVEGEGEWTIRSIGAHLAQARGEEPHDSLSAVPMSLLLSRVAEACARMPQGQAPLAFESDESSSILYRGILLPFARDGSINRLIGVVSWKPAAGGAPKPMAEQPHCAGSEGAGPLVAWADGPLTAADFTGGDALAHRLAALPATTLADLPARGGAFTLLLARRVGEGGLELLGEVPEEPALLEHASRLLLR